MKKAFLRLGTMFLSFISLMLLDSHSHATTYSFDFQDLRGTYYADHSFVFDQSFKWDESFEMAGGKTQYHDFGDPFGPMSSINITITGAVLQRPLFLYSDGNVYERNVDIVKGYRFHDLSGDGYSADRGWTYNLPYGQWTYSGDYYDYLLNFSLEGPFVYSQTRTNSTGEGDFFSEGTETGLVSLMLGFWTHKEDLARKIDPNNWQTVYEDLSLIQPGIIDVQSVRFTVETNPVPEPATMLLLVSGLVGLAGLRWKIG